MTIKIISEHKTSTGRDENGTPVSEVFYRVVINSDGNVLLCDGYDNPCDCLDWLPSEEIYEDVYDSDIVKWLEDYKQLTRCQLKGVKEQHSKLDKEIKSLWNTLDNLHEAKIK